MGEHTFMKLGVSGLIEVGSDVKPSKTQPEDPKLTEFRMGRFILAAKVIVADVCQHTVKKAVVNEEPREVKKLVNVNVDCKKRQQQLSYGPNCLEDVAHDKEKDDSDSNHHGHGNPCLKFCGLIPSFHSGNLVHGMCMSTKIPLSHVSRTHASSSNVSSNLPRWEHTSRGLSLLFQKANPLGTKSGRIWGSYNALQPPDFKFFRT